MSSLLIEGPSKISGEVRVGGNKNAVLPMIAAAMLTDEPVILHNVPDILDVRNMLELARVLGAEIKREGKSVEICAKNIQLTKLPRNLCTAIRTSLLFAGPLAMRTGSAQLWPPGGDVIGKRRLDSHFYGLRKLGIMVEAEESPYTFVRVGSSEEEIDMFLDEASVTATEHILTAAALRKGKTIIRNAASEPHITQLAQLLSAMGAEISGIETNILSIIGKEKLHGAEFTIEGDHIEAASFLALCAAAKGTIDVTGIISPHHYWMTRRVFEKFGADLRLEPNHIHMDCRKGLQIEPDFGNAVPTISDGPWPQFPSDMMSCMIVAATQAKGTVLFFEKMFESRIYFVDRLNGMGANAIVCDPHRVVISGPAKLRGTELVSPDIRAGMAMVIAGCCAEGQTIVNRAEMVYRGYENLSEKLTNLGVNVKAID
ncbi:MAG: UDP-N-acetylglucosamine 1-carboxyvinyltransferase [Lentisphaerae bacterium]|nr:UDP-N-acetylglucosamine 1-carboxyvinyltransferase [Lentisphaerota bacterium]